MKKRSPLSMILNYIFITSFIFSAAQAQPQRFALQPRSSGAHKSKAAEILDDCDVQGGLIVHIGCGDGKLTAALCANDSYLVHGLDPDVKNIEKARKHIQSLKLYGKVSVDRLNGSRLPYIDNLVNLVVSEQLGHASPATTANMYADISFEDMQNGVNGLYDQQ